MYHHHLQHLLSNYTQQRLYIQALQIHHRFHRRQYRLNSYHRSHILHLLQVHHIHNPNHCYSMSHHHLQHLLSNYTQQSRYIQQFQIHHKFHRCQYQLSSCHHNHIQHLLLVHHNHNPNHYYSMSHHRLQRLINNYMQ